METPANDSNISFLDTRCSPHSGHTTHASVYRKPIHTSHFLDWNSNHLISAKNNHPCPNLQSKNICSTPEILAKEIDYNQNRGLKNNYPDWMIKETKKKPASHIINPATGLEVKKIS